MLVLSRKQTERIEIDGGIVLTVLEIKGKRVRIGVEAPDKTEIRRMELKKPAHAGSPTTVSRIKR